MADTPEIFEAARADLERWKTATEAGRRFVADYDRETTPHRAHDGAWQVEARHRTTAVWWCFTFSRTDERLALRSMTKAETVRTRV